MAHPLHHAESSARKFGGKPSDYQCLHDWFDSSKEHLALFGVDSGWVQNSTLSTEDALAVVSQIAVRVDVAIESNGPHT